MPFGLVAVLFVAWVYTLLANDIQLDRMDTKPAAPGLALALAVGAVLGQGLVNAMAAIGVVCASVFARLVQGQALSIREEEYVVAARSLSAGHFRIMVRHI